jgi:uncharacterized membrane protein YfcA
MVSGAGAGLLAGLIGIGGGIVVVPVVFYGLVEAGTPVDQAAHPDRPFMLRCITGRRRWSAR